MASPLSSMCRILKKCPLRATHAEPSSSTSQISGIRLAFETLHFRESTRTFFPSSANDTLYSMSSDVNHRHPVASLFTFTGECDRRQAPDIPGNSSIRVRDSRSRMFRTPAQGTHSLPYSSSLHRLTKSLANAGSVFVEKRMKESPSYRTSPPPKVLIQAKPLLSK